MSEKSNSGNSKRDIVQKGEGFVYKDKEFVPHTRLPHYESAFFSFTPVQKGWIALASALMLLALVLKWHTTLVAVFALLTVAYFVDLLFNFFLIVRSFAVETKISVSEEDVLKNRDWPTYTIFCPLYKEWQVVPQFIEAMGKLDYPTEKLQIILLLEDDDKQTISEVEKMDLPVNFFVVIVPHSMPKTKPKAMNYGLRMVRGEYITIYDAEDVPDPLQLKKAVLAFERASGDTVCIQAKLNFYNPKQNLLTRIFTAEYSLWFDLVLPGLQSIGAPIPLGGTSNHFRAQQLKDLHGWDAFNVTEDCDLGMRLAKRGFKTAMLDSTTLEEANSNLFNWYRQRSRWIKGYMQTYLVHMRQPAGFLQKGRRKHWAIFQLVVGGKILSMFINPLLWVVTICYFAFRAHVGTFVESFFPTPILYIGVFSLVFGNFLYLFYYMVGCAKRELWSLIKYAFAVPFYWLGMSAAAWQGLYEVVVKPHYWAKTIHGLHLNKQEAKLQSIDTKILPSAPSYYGQFKNLWKGKMAGGGFYVLAALVSNFLNFLFNALMGRRLTLEDFGTLTLFNTVLALLAVFLGSLSSVVNYKTAFFSGKNLRTEALRFTKNTQRIILYLGVVASALWILLIPQFVRFFNVQRLSLVFLFTPVLSLGAIAAVQSGYLKGKFYFELVGRAMVYEALSKVVFAALLVQVGLHEWASLSVPGSIVVSCLFFSFYMKKASRQDPVDDSALRNEHLLNFPFNYFGAAVVSSVAGAVFLNVDVLLAKHYLSPSVAGAYALLSLVGKMVYFFGSLLSSFIVSIVSRHEGAGTNPRKDFYRLFLGTVGFSIVGFLGAGVLGKFTVPLLFGTTSSAILPFLFDYCLAMVLFTLSATIISYHLAKREYAFAGLSMISSVLLVVGIVRFHDGIGDFTRMMLLSSLFNFAVIAFWHGAKKNTRFILRNITDLFDVFLPLPQKPNDGNPGAKRILVFNWRDTRHVFTGGAEVYIHELAKRWVSAGHAVTLFCGNDGKSPRNEIVDGVQVVRRGGFYFVYVWAFVYYLVQFRGRYDVIVDCQNGIPFFTPLYAKEPVYCLLHHVHQEIFSKYLSWPLASIAAFLENTAMPFVYRNTKFITVSQSSLKDMEKLGLGKAGIEVVFPGVDLENLRPAARSQQPTVLYLGRLKAYKSIDVLIKAFKKVLEKIPVAQLVIAGSGEQGKYLKKLSEDLGLSQRVHFKGQVNESEKIELLQQSWVFVNPSVMEGWGITTIEANACGVPVVASNVPGLRESVKNPHTGFLVEHGNVEEFSAKIFTLLENHSLREGMRSEGILWAKNFDWNKSSRKFLEAIINPEAEMSAAGEPEQV